MPDAEAPPGEIATAEKPPSAEAVQNVVEWLIAGKTIYDVSAAVKEHFPGEDPETVILAATDEIQEAAQMDPEAILGWCIMATRDIYKKSLAIGDFACALSCVKQIHNMARR